MLSCRIADVIPEILSMVAITATYAVAAVAFIEGDRIRFWLARWWRARRGQ
jgi:hypothetical protein